jgi:hypothetical protein
LNPDLMRVIDYWVGIPLVFLLTLVFRVQRFMGLATSPVGRPRNILLIQLAEMGTMVVAYPALKKTRELYPDATLYFLCFAQIRSSVEMLEIIPSENIITVNPHSVLSLARDTARFLWRARRSRIDTVINLEAFVRYSSMLSYLCGAYRRVGFHRFNQEGLYAGDLLTHKVLHNAHIHARAYVPRSRARARLADGPGAARETAASDGLPRGSEDLGRRDHHRHHLAEAARDPCRHRTHPEARRAQSQRQ